jgi:hypothetical protein
MHTDHIGKLAYISEGATKMYDWRTQSWHQSDFFDYRFYILECVCLGYIGKYHSLFFVVYQMQWDVHLCHY